MMALGSRRPSLWLWVTVLLAACAPKRMVLDDPLEPTPLPTRETAATDARPHIDREWITDAGVPVRADVVASSTPPATTAAEAPATLPPLQRSEQRAGEEANGRNDGHTARIYTGRPVSLDLKEADVHNVLRLLAEVSKLNIVATDDVTGNITLHLFDVPWDQALDIVLQVMNLERVQEANVIRISTVKRLREEREELRRAQAAAQGIEPLQVAYLRVNYARAENLAELIGGAGTQPENLQPTPEDGTEEPAHNGLLSTRGSVMVDEFTNTLVVRDIPPGIAAAQELVRRLDVPTPQVLIESRIVEANSDFARELGIQWGYRASVGPQTGTSTGKNFPGTIVFGGSGLGEGSGGVPFIADFPAAGVMPGLGTALDLALGSINGAEALDIRITALEQKGVARIISRPRVVTLNNVAATIKSLTILRVRLPGTGTIINTGEGGTAGTAQTATEKIETGIILIVTPQVSSDGYVLLDMFTKSSVADFSLEVDDIPTEIAREATSHVLVRDGETIVLGGIYRDVASRRWEGVPFFKDIPVLGWLFKSRSERDRREDLLVFLTPRIVGGVGVATQMPTGAELWERRGARGPG